MPKDWTPELLQEAWAHDETFRVLADDLLESGLIQIKPFSDIGERQQMMRMMRMTSEQDWSLFQIEDATRRWIGNRLGWIVRHSPKDDERWFVVAKDRAGFESESKCAYPALRTTKRP